MPRFRTSSASFLNLILYASRCAASRAPLALACSSAARDAACCFSSTAAVRRPTASSSSRTRLSLDSARLRRSSRSPACSASSASLRRANSCRVNLANAASRQARSQGPHLAARARSSGPIFASACPSFLFRSRMVFSWNSAGASALTVIASSLPYA